VTGSGHCCEPAAPSAALLDHRRPLPRSRPTRRPTQPRRPDPHSPARAPLAGPHRRIADSAPGSRPPAPRLRSQTLRSRPSEDLAHPPSRLTGCGTHLPYGPSEDLAHPLSRLTGCGTHLPYGPSEDLAHPLSRLRVADGHPARPRSKGDPPGRLRVAGGCSARPAEGSEARRRPVASAYDRLTRTETVYPSNDAVYLHAKTAHQLVAHFSKTLLHPLWGWRRVTVVPRGRTGRTAKGSVPVAAGGEWKRKARASWPEALKPQG